MKLNQPQFKMRKPVSLTLDFLDPAQPKSITPKLQIPEVDTFEEFCSNLPDNQKEEVNFSNKSQSFDNQRSQTSSLSEFKPSTYRQMQTELEEQSQIQYFVFEEFHPQSTVITNQSESVRNSHVIESPSEGVREPPAPQNKNNTRFSFPCKTGGLSGLKKQLQIAIPEVEHNKTSSYEQTIVKQQAQQAQNNTCDLNELKQQILNLQNEAELVKIVNKQQINDIMVRKLQVEKQLESEIQHNLQLQTDNEKLIKRLQMAEHQQQSMIDKNQSDNLSISYPQKLCDSDKIAYLIEKVHKKSNQNAKLQYEILKLQNHIEMLQTKQMMHSQNVYQMSDGEFQSDLSPPPGMFPRPKNDTKTNGTLNQPKTLNMSAQYQMEQRKVVNLSHLVSPMARTSKQNSKNVTTHSSKPPQQFKEDTLQNLRKMQSTKNSTSVGDLNSFKPDLTNCSNILCKIMRKDSHSTQSPERPLYATQKFKETLNAKLLNVPDKHKSYASLLFSLGDLGRPKLNDAYIRQHSPYTNEEQNRINNHNLHPNSRKQSETIKSEESHKLSTEQPKHLDNSHYQRKGNNSNELDVLQLMKDIKSQKLGITTKINYQKVHQRTTITESKSSRNNKPNFD